ncbi:30S ribosomal protein S9 [Candidatus Vidania fulgoroideorum]
MIGKWYYGFGRKKTSKSKVFLKSGTGKIKINGKPIITYFKKNNLINYINEPFKIIKNFNFDILINTKGGGCVSRAISSMYAISRALVDYNFFYKKNLKKNLLLILDKRIVERKKTGYIKSRKKKQYSKR